MPIVPVETPQLSTNVPGVNGPLPREYGKIGAAIAGLGTDVEQSGMDALTQVKHAEALDASATAYAQNKLDANAKMIELKLNSPDGYVHSDPKDPTSAPQFDENNEPVTITKAFHDWADKQYQDTQSKMPSMLAANMYKERALPYLSDQTAMLQNEVQTMKVNAFDQKSLMKVKALGGDPSMVPVIQQGSMYGPTRTPVIDANKFYGNLQDSLMDVKAQIGSIYNETEAQKRMTEFGHTMTEETVRNLYTNILDEKKTGSTTYAQDIHALYDFYRGEDPQSKARARVGLPTFSSVMDPKTREIQLDKLDKLLSTAKQLDWENLKHATDETIDAQKTGRSQGNENLQNLIMQHFQRGVIEPQHAAEAADWIGKLFASHEIGRMSGPEYDILSSNDRRAMAGNAEIRTKEFAHQAAVNLGVPYSADFGSIVSTAIHQQFEEYNKKIDGEQSKDLAAFAQTPVDAHHGSSRLTAGAKVATFDYSSIPGLALGNKPQFYAAWARDFDNNSKTRWADHPENFRAPITLTQSKLIADQLKTTQGPNALNEEQRGAAVTSLSKFWGKDFSRNIDQMIGDGNLPESYRIVGLHAQDNSPGSNKFLMSALGSATTTDTLFKKMTADDPTVDAAIKKEVSKVSKDWIASQMQGDPLSQANQARALQLQTVIETGARIQYMHTQNPDAETAAKESYNQLVGKFVHINQSKSSGLFGTGLGASVTGSDYIPKTVNTRHGPLNISDEDNATLQHNRSDDMTNLEKFSPAIPTRGDGQPSLQADKFIDMVKRTGQMKYTTSPELGSVIHYADPQSGMDTVVMKRNAQGKLEPLFFPLKDQLAPRGGEQSQKMEMGPIQKFQPGRSPQSVSGPEVYPAKESGGLQTLSDEQLLSMTGGSKARLDAYEAASKAQSGQGGTDKPTGVRAEYDKNGKRSWRILHQ